MITTVVAIDLNVRVKGNQTFAGYEDISGPIPEVGDQVQAIEVESGLTAIATVAAMDAEHRLIFLAIPWIELNSVR